jgi:heat shock protein HslJ
LERLRGQPPIAGSTITLEFESGRLGGSAGCNGYGGPYQVEGDQLTVGELARTLMYCQDPAGLMDQEDGFLEALATVARYRTTAGRLELLDGAGQVVLALVPPPPTPAAALEGTEWVLTTLLDGAAAASILDGTEITLRLEQGRAAGTAGCNSYGGSYNRQGDALEIGALVRTEMFCQDPAGLMEQEDHYLDLLQRATSLELDGDQLTLRAPDGTGLVFRAR